MFPHSPEFYFKIEFSTRYLVPATDLKIDWIWHLLLKIEAGVIGPTLLYSSITKSHFSRFYSFYTLIININGINTRKM